MHTLPTSMRPSLRLSKTVCLAVLLLLSRTHTNIIIFLSYRRHTLNCLEIDKPKVSCDTLQNSSSRYCYCPAPCSNLYCCCCQTTVARISTRSHNRLLTHTALQLRHSCGSHSAAAATDADKKLSSLLLLPWAGCSTSTRSSAAAATAAAAGPLRHC
jgi:hypothetical protein